jgi:hypothetical protein
MIQLILLILGASVGGQFGTLGSIVGAFIGLALASPKSQPESMAGSNNDTEITPNFSWLTDGIPSASSMSSCEPEGPGLQMDLQDSLPDTTVEPLSLSEPTYINPASGLPMIDDGIGGVDVGGNIFGTSSDDHF